CVYPHRPTVSLFMPHGRSCGMQWDALPTVAGSPSGEVIHACVFVFIGVHELTSFGLPTFAVKSGMPVRHRGQESPTR
ncbi:hypothetical protein, partial [Parapedobacter defluvii]|uniref:hypothetical protein n=1 Tax=Parapedobacter defluvii TaxID=2045106 RepID=UPI0033428722